MLKIFTTSSNIASCLSEKKSDKIINLSKIYYIYFLDRFFGKRPYISFNFLYQKKSFSICISSLEDIETLNELFVIGVYQLSVDLNPNTIVDLGSNIGLSAIYFALKYEDSKIFALEPNPDIFKQLKINTRKFSNIYCFNKLVSDKDGEVEFYLSTDRTHSSSLIKRSNCSKTCNVQSISLPNLIRELNIPVIDLLKFDIEGAEFLILDDIIPNKVKNFIGEVHMDLSNKTIDKSLGLDKFYQLKIGDGNMRYILAGSAF